MIGLAAVNCGLSGYGEFVVVPESPDASWSWNQPAGTVDTGAITLPPVPLGATYVDLNINHPYTLGGKVINECVSSTTVLSGTATLVEQHHDNGQVTNEAFQNAPSVCQVPTRVIAIFPPTTLTMRRTRMQALMPYRPLRILRASSARLPSRSRTTLSPSLSCATRSPRLSHFDLRLTAIFSARALLGWEPEVSTGSRSKPRARPSRPAAARKARGGKPHEVALRNKLRQRIGG